MAVVRVGIVGVGGMGSFHARTLASLAGAEVVTISDPSPTNAAAIRDELGAEVVDDPMALIDPDAIDALVIASPDATHAELAIAAIGHAIPTLCEKPLASSVEDARRVVDAEVAGGRRLIQLGFMREYDPAHVQVLAELDGLGRIDHIRAFHRNANTTRRSLEQIVVQSMVHDVHSVRFLTGREVTSVFASGAGPDDDSFRHVLAVCELDGGAHAVLEFDDGGFAYEVGVEILARAGDVLTGPPTRAVVRHDGGIDVHLGTDWFGWFADAYRAQDRAWIESIRATTPSGPTAWDGYRSQLVVDAILRSLSAGRPVEVDPVDTPPLYA